VTSFLITQTIRLTGDVDIRVYGPGNAPDYAPPAPGVEITFRHGSVALSAAGDPAEVRTAIEKLRAALAALDTIVASDQ
jgi:hypothetical protein